MAAKRRLELDFDVSEVKYPTSDVNVHGIVTELSPVKKSRQNEKVQYFDGKLSDGKKTLRIVSFEPALRNKMDESRIQRTPVTIMNCQVKQKTKFVSENDTLEILASSKSKVQLSPHKLDLPENIESDLQPLSSINLDEIDDVSVGQYVAISGKVILLQEPATLQSRSGTDLRKQESIIADSTSQIRCVLWQEQIGELLINKSYKLEKIAVKMYNDIKYLSVSSNTVITLIDDVGEVANSPTDDILVPDNGNRVLEGCIVGVISIDQYPSCFNCKGKVDTVSPTMGQCSRCTMQIRMNSCDKGTTANLVFQPDSGNKEKIRITMFTNELKAIISDGPVEAEKLFGIDKVKLCINAKNIAYSASLI